MEKKTIYIIVGVATVVLIAVIALMAFNNPNPSPEPIGGNPTDPNKPQQKTEIEVTKEIGGQRIILEDNGSTYSLTPGAKLVLMLGTEYKWNITSSDETILAKRDITASDPRIQAIYQVAKAGKATLNATGTCIATSGCTAPAPFKLNVEGVISDDENAENLVNGTAGKAPATK